MKARRSRSVVQTISVWIALVLVVAACGGGAADPPATEPPSGGPTTTSAGTNPTQPPASDTTPSGSGETRFESGSGWFEVDEERYEPEYVVRCIVAEPLFGEVNPKDLDIRGHTFGRSAGFEVAVSFAEFPDLSTGAMIETVNVVYFLHLGGDGIRQFDGEVGTDLQGNWPEGTDLTIEPGRIAGTATMVQSYPDEGETVEVAFDYSLPGEEFDCDEL